MYHFFIFTIFITLSYSQTCSDDSYHIYNNENIPVFTVNDTSCYCHNKDLSIDIGRIEGSSNWIGIDINNNNEGSFRRWSLYNAKYEDYNAFEIWEYSNPDGDDIICSDDDGGVCSKRLELRKGGDLILSPNGGNIGVSTFDPKAKLHIASRVSLDSHYSLLADAIVEGLEGRLQLIGLDDSTGSAGLILTNVKNNTDNRHWTIYHHTELSNSPNSLTIGYTNTVQNGDDTFPVDIKDIKLTITKDGNIGIGTDNPTARLHVKNDPVFSGSENQTNINIDASGTTAFSQIVFSHEGVKKGLVYQHFDENFIGIGGGEELKTMFVKPETGNVGIRTYSPKATLDINGFMKMAKYTEEPSICDINTDGSISLTSTYRTCVCKNGVGWVYTSDGTTSCSWQ
eukprot:TRINITY_DN5334_c0_g1_i1.p1 TRINITY_DN5334_c0_g1~~TRINITY_DN5334_c0_g1_i1.p1  ORF type:complete len:398 (-),score=50.01 TRINITY_DN5334_c0_g1_i1:42-1235(-)